MSEPEEELSMSLHLNEEDPDRESYPTDIEVSVVNPLSVDADNEQEDEPEVFVDETKIQDQLNQIQEQMQEELIMQQKESNKSTQTSSRIRSKELTREPSVVPSIHPSKQQSKLPSAIPSVQPSVVPSSQPSKVSSVVPSVQPSKQPSVVPSVQPSKVSSVVPSVQPSKQPSVVPSVQPSKVSSVVPSVQPSRQPSKQPSVQSSAIQSVVPSVAPSKVPSVVPSSQPSKVPSGVPSVQPSVQPSNVPSVVPSLQPSKVSSVVPSVQPSNVPSVVPSLQPSVQPSKVPSRHSSKVSSRRNSYKEESIPLETVEETVFPTETVIEIEPSPSTHPIHNEEKERNIISVRNRKIDRRNLANDILAELPISIRFNESIYIDNDEEITNYTGDWEKWVEDGTDNLKILLEEISIDELKYKRLARWNSGWTKAIQMGLLVVGSAIVYVQASGKATPEQINQFNIASGGVTTISSLCLQVFAFNKKAPHYTKVYQNLQQLRCWVESKLILPIHKRFSAYDIFAIARKAYDVILLEARAGPDSAK